MAELNLLLKLRDVVGVTINPRKEDGHGSSAGTPTHVSVAAGATAAKQDTGNASLANIATDTLQIGINTGATVQSLGGDGSSPPALPGGATGVRGWLRGVFEYLRDRLPSVPYLDRLKVSDRLTGFEALEDQPGAGGVLTFTFAAAPDLIWVRSVGGISRAHPAGGTPTASNGVYCADDEPTPITISGQLTVNVFAPAATVVSVWGYRYS